VLPKAPTEPRKPKERAQPEPKPEPKPAPPKPQPRKQERYEDVLAGLRAERGEERPDPVERAAPPAASATSPTPGAGPQAAGSPIDAAIAAWLRAAKLHVEQAWVLPPGFQRESLLAVVRVPLDGAGRVLAEPRVVRRSGNPWYDESVVRAIQKASPLPPPPEAGEWEFEFRPPGGSV
jgi:TonB family protein